MATWEQEVNADAPNIWFRFNGDANSADVTSMGASVTANNVNYVPGIKGDQAASTASNQTSVRFTWPVSQGGFWGNNWAIEVWFKLDFAYNYYNTITRIGSSTGNRQFGFRVRGTRHGSAGRQNQLEAFIYDGTGWSAVGGPTNYNVNDNQWHHAVLQSSGSSTYRQLSMFIDGVDRSTLVGSDPATHLPFGTSLGGYTQGIMVGPLDNVEWMEKGSVDELLIYNKALTPARIAAHYEATNTVIKRGWGILL